MTSILSVYAITKSFQHRRLSSPAITAFNQGVCRLSSPQITAIKPKIPIPATIAFNRGVVRNAASPYCCHSNKVGGGEDKVGGGDDEEVSLREFKMSDVDALVSWGDEKDELMQSLGWAHEIFRTKEQSIDVLLNYFIPHPFMWAICLADRPVGRIVLDPRPPNENGECLADLSYLVIAKHRGRGIATKAVKLLLATIFDECPVLDLIEATVNVQNIASAKVVTKAGFRHLGILKEADSGSDGRKMDLSIFVFNRVMRAKNARAKKPRARVKRAKKPRVKKEKGE